MWKRNQLLKNIYVYITGVETPGITFFSELAVVILLNDCSKRGSNPNQSIKMIKGTVVVIRPYTNIHQSKTKSEVSDSSKC